MRVRSVFTCLFAGLALATPAPAQVIEGFEAGIPAGWTLTGTGGTSGAAPNVAPTEGASFGYIDTRSFLPTTVYGGTQGTTLESSAYSLASGSEVSLDYNFLTVDYNPFRDFAFVQLVDDSDGTVVATVGNAQVNNGQLCLAPMQIVPAISSSGAVTPPAISAGVTLAPATATLNQVPTTVGPSNYCSSTGWITTSFVVPYSGDFRFLFVVSDVLDVVFDTGLAVDNIRISSAPNAPPVADAGADRTVECTSPGGDAVTLDGTGSFDPENGALTYAWSAIGVTFDDPTSATPTGTFLLGTTTVSLTVTDDAGNTDVDTVDVTVEDTTAPSVDCSTDVDVLWPPNHRKVSVQISIAADDACVATGDLTVDLATASSSEQDNGTGFGDGDTDGDVNCDDGFSAPVPITGLAYNAATDRFEGSVLLRAERNGTGGGRFYTLDFTISDGNGNSTPSSCTVVVPKSRGKK